MKPLYVALLTCKVYWSAIDAGTTSVGLSVELTLGFDALTA